MDNSQNSFLNKPVEAIPFFKPVEDFDLLTFEVLYVIMPRDFVDKCQPMAQTEERLKEEWQDYLEGMRYVE